MKASEIVALATEIAGQKLAGSMIELTDVEYVCENGRRYLRLYIDQPGGIHLDDCQRVSEMVGAALDEIRELRQSYFLEVSSPGLDRKLKKDSDFVRFAGRKINIRLYRAVDGRKNISGTLVGLSEDRRQVLLTDDGGAELRVERDDIGQVRLAVEF
ncbi:MAG: ribosome maturation factor RimP [Negativicutes bacterium]|nr:ribosome maturation factor RimP [Negativicutes bacterium]